MSKTQDIVGDIIAYESGEMDEPQVLEFFQKLVDSGMAWSLQGSYGRMAASLIEAGLVNRASVSLPQTS